MIRPFESKNDAKIKLCFDIYSNIIIFLFDCSKEGEVDSVSALWISEQRLRVGV